jgi:hypothetical protein
MKSKPISEKKASLFIAVLLTTLGFASYGQYLPLAGGTMTGNLNMNTATQIQSPYYGFNAFFTQPATSSNFAMFPNISTGTIDIVAQGWRFIPASSSTYSASVATIDNSGNTYLAKTLVIGGARMPPSYVLAVYGNAIATSITVQSSTGWPDYVFKPSFHLPSLTKVKTYIDQNHHLPEIPSAEQIQKDGLNLGEMNKLLVKKVEELTLYLIEQNKRIEKLESQIKTQQK